MRKFTILKVMFLAFILANSVNLLGQTTVTYTFADKGFANSEVVTSGAIDANLSYLAEKNGANAAPTYYSADAALRMYSVRASGDGNSYTINTSNGVVIKGLEISALTSYTPTVKYSVDGGALQDATLNGTTYTISGVNAATSLKFVNAHTGGTTNLQLRIVSFKVTYTVNAAAPSIVVSPASLDFGKTNLNTASVAQTINVTGANLTAAPTFSVDNTDFEVTGTLTATGGDLSVVFKPTSTGVKTGTLTVTGSGQTKAIALSGTGFDPANPYNLDDSAPVNSLNETFGDGTVTAATLPVGWTSVALQGNRNWDVRRLVAANNNYAQMTAYGGSGVYQTLLISPAINFDAPINKANVKFDWNSGYTKPGTILKVYVLSKDGTKTEVKSIDDNSNPTGPGAAFTTETLDLSAHSGTKFLAFEYNGDAASTTTTYQVDNVVVAVASGIFSPKTESLNVSVQNGKIVFDAAQGETVEVFNAVGQRLLSQPTVEGKNELTVVNKGATIVRIANRVGKIML